MKRLLLNILRFLSVGAFTLLLAACYGVPVPPDGQSSDSSSPATLSGLTVEQPR